MALQVGSTITTPIALSANTAGPLSSPGTPNIAVTAHVQRPDTVKLSLSANIQLLKSQGQSAQQIATNLGIDTKSVATYFGIPPAKTVAATPAVKPSVATPNVKTVVATPAVKIDAGTTSVRPAASAPAK